jgi:probable F420-dependent oxidoreductase
MTNTRPFRFGIINEQPGSAAEWFAAARRTEALGYATFLLRDHFVPEPFGDQFAPFPALMAAALATTVLRVGTLVCDNDYRHPVMLAKEAATLDLLSGGRLELGLGAGWLRAEYEAAGMGFDPNSLRVARFAEAVQIIRGLFAAEPLTFAGEHYRVQGLTNFPRPAQRPGPPLLIGGGKRRMLTLAGQYADIVGLLTTSVASGAQEDGIEERLVSAVEQKLAWIRAGAGARFDAIELSLIPTVLIDDDREGAAERLIAARGWRDVTTAEVLAMPSVLIGTVAEIGEAIWERRERYGFSYYIFGDAQREGCAPLVANLAGH